MLLWRANSLADGFPMHQVFYNYYHPNINQSISQYAQKSYADERVNDIPGNYPAQFFLLKENRGKNKSD